MSSVLNRYLDPEVLSHVADRALEPQGLVIGNLAGAHKSPLSGFAVEFSGHREYAPGDDPRHVDWRVYYTRDKYFVKQYELETNFVCHLLVDISASMRYGEPPAEKLDYAARMAAALAYSIVRQTDKVSLASFDQTVRGFLPPGNSLDQIVRITQHLHELKAVERTSIGPCLNDLTGRMGRREIVMVFSDFFVDLEELEEALQRMRYHRHEVVLFQVLHHDELEFDFDGMVKFVGLEIDEQYLAQPHELRRAYLEALGEFNQRLIEIAQRNRCEHILVDTSRSVRQTLLDYLNQRSQMKRGR